ncbi:Ribose import ATP-binding protein RbsA 2 [Nymphon striatum]|nr:Ribose import ATP-binding protein RbsA 2 [Nymphon striatum]
MTARGLAHAIVASLSVIDFEIVVIDGTLPPNIKDKIIECTSKETGLLDLQGIAKPEIKAGHFGDLARAVGAASVGEFSTASKVDQLPQAEQAPLVSLQSATKIFGGTVAINNVSFDITAGEVLALLGENGAGKSTCVKLLAGVYRADEGQILVKGHVAENIFFGRFPKTSLGALDYAAMTTATEELLETVGLSIPPSQLLRSLSVSEQQLVEVARALSANADVLIMDEPTAALSQREVEKLFVVVERLKARGVGIVFVGHRMDEIFRVSDRIAVLRDGEMLAVEPADKLTREDAISMMAGRKLSSLYPQRDPSSGRHCFGSRQAFDRWRI